MPGRACGVSLRPVASLTAAFKAIEQGTVVKIDRKVICKPGCRAFSSQSQAVTRQCIRCLIMPLRCKEARPVQGVQ